MITVEFRKQGGSPGISLEQVIPDTGADASALPWADCEQLALDPGEGAPGLMGGVGETAMRPWSSGLGPSLLALLPWGS